MVIASHVTFGAYGFWLPNDPRGSWSTYVASWELYRRGGPATKVDSPRSHARDPHDRSRRLATKQGLKYPPVVLDERQRAAAAMGMGGFAERNGLVILACAVLAEHVHLVLGRHHYDAERAATLLKGAATRELEERGIHPMHAFPKVRDRRPKCWARGQWTVFLDSASDVERAVKYVDDNPPKEGLPRQSWEFVTDLATWLADLDAP